MLCSFEFTSLPGILIQPRCIPRRNSSRHRKYLVQRRIGISVLEFHTPYAKPMPKSKANQIPPRAQSFQATLERMKSRLNWIIIHIPFDVAKLWGSRGQFRVKGEINGFAFRTSLFPTGQGAVSYTHLTLPTNREV